MKNIDKNSETVTISKTEYTSLKEIESEWKWLKEQLQTMKKKTFGSTSEQTKLFEQISMFFNEAEALEDTEDKNQGTTVQQHTRKKKTGIFDKLPENVESYTVEHTLSEEERKCPNCGDEMEVIARRLSSTSKLFLHRQLSVRMFTTPTPASSAMRMKQIHL